VTPAAATDSGKKSRQHDQQDNSSDSGFAENKSASNKKTTAQLSSEESAEVQRLAQRDREVRAHEAAHKGVAGHYARGGAEYEYERGPDGRQYAVAGEVSIDVSRPNDASAALQKALLIQRAALAPAQPSAQDRAVAAEAAQMAAQARTDLQREQADASEAADDLPNSTIANPIEQAYAADTDTRKPLIDISI
jgi:hypothetical protein